MGVLNLSPALSPSLPGGAGALNLLPGFAAAGALQYGLLLHYAMDSRMEKAITPYPWTDAADGASSNYLEAHSPLAWGLAHCGGRVSAISPNYAIGAEDTSEFLAGTNSTMWADFQAAVIAAGGGVLFFLGGANDRGGANLSLATTKANITTIMDFCGENNVLLLLCNEMPYGALSGAQLQNHYDFRDWAESSAVGGALYGRSYVKSVNTWDASAQGRSINLFKAGYSDDELHLLLLGNAAVGEEALAPVVLANFADNGFTQLASQNATGVLNSNPGMTGTGGTVGPQFTGTAPDGWATQVSTGTGLTFAISTEMRGGKLCTRIDIGGTSSAAHPEVFVYNALDLATLEEGVDYAFCAGNVEWEGLVNVRTVTLQTANNGVTNKSRALNGWADDDLFPAASDGVQLQRTLECLRKTGATAVRVGVLIQPGLADVACEGTVWVSDVTGRKYDTALALPDQTYNLFDADGKRLLDADGKILLVNH